MRLLQHAGRKVEEGLGGRKLGHFFGHVELALHLAGDLFVFL